MPATAIVAPRTPRDFHLSLREDLDTIVATLERMPIGHGDVLVVHTTLLSLGQTGQLIETVRAWLDRTGRQNVLVLVVPAAADLSLATLDVEAMRESGWTRTDEVADLLVAARRLRERRAALLADVREHVPADPRALIEASRAVCAAVAAIDDDAPSARLAA